MVKQLRIGTRKSRLALIQAELAVRALKKEHGDDLHCEVIEIVSSGDQTQAANTCLSDIGGKGLFIKEIEEALLRGTIDVAVHSMKDVPGIMTEACDIAAVLMREDPRDVFISPKAKKIKDLPEGAVIGTCSPRRAAQLLAKRPDLKTVTFRGNVETRLKKLEDGVADATLLAAAGLKRLGLLDKIQTVLDPGIMLPAVGQGVIGLEIRKDDDTTRDLVKPVNCRETMLCLTAERSMLAELDGDCTTPIAGLAEIQREYLILRGLVARPDGSDIRAETITMKANTLDDALDLGRSVARQLKTGLPADFFNGTAA